MLRRRRLLRQLRSLHTDALNWALVCCNYDRELAEDVLQTVYLKVLEGKARFAGRSMLRTWLLGVVRNTAREAARKTLPLLMPLREEATNTTDVLDNDSLAFAMQELSDMQRQVIFLVFHRDFTLEEVASILGIQIGSVRTHYHRAKQKLKFRLTSDEQFDTEERRQSIL
ncbi:MAG: RNA polymerase sigma factor [Gammaproteobacteria bacterium]|nr:RNA polymerase sigma factor [Gammaproteobacteria bacterium]